MKKMSERNRRQYLNIVPIALTTFSLGAGFGWIGPAINYYSSGHSAFQISTSEISWIAAAYSATQFVTPVFAIICSKHMGRKPILTSATFFVIISWTIITFTRSAYMVIVARVFLGLAGGFNDIIWSIYVAEFAESDKRSVISAFLGTMVIIGTLAQIFSSLFLHYELLSVIPLALASIGFIWYFYMVESPYLLLARGNEAEALKTLIWLRDATEEEVRCELLEIKCYVEQEHKDRRSINHILKNPCQNRVYLVCVAIFGFMGFNGFVPILTYIGLISNSYKGFPSGNMIIFIFGVLSLISMFIAPMIIERVGRRTLLMCGFMGSAAVLVSVSFLFYVNRYNLFVIPFFPQTIVFLFSTLIVLFCLFIASPAYIVRGELFPEKFKMIGSAASIICNAAVNFTLLKMFIPIKNDYGIHLNFLMYSDFCILISIAIYLILPETKGKTLVEIHKCIMEARGTAEPKKAMQMEAPMSGGDQTSNSAPSVFSIVVST